MVNCDSSEVGTLGVIGVDIFPPYGGGTHTRPPVTHSKIPVEGK